MEELVSGSVTFNKFKVKYVYMNEYFLFNQNAQEKKTFYFFIDFDYVLRQYMHSLECFDFRYIDDNFTDNFVVGLLNLISHYKNYFYRHCDSISYFYIGVDRKQYVKYENIDKMFHKIVSIVNMIPRINFYYCESKEQKFFLKYNLIRIIKRVKEGDGRIIFLDICRPYMNELVYMLTKDYNYIQYDQREQTTMYGFYNFRTECMRNVPPIYINTVIKLLPVYEALNELEIHDQKKIDNVIMDFILKNKKADFNDDATKELVLKMFTSKRKAVNKLRKLIGKLNNPLYETTMTTIIKSWNNHIKDNSIYKINEIMKVPDRCRINIELLMNY